VRATKRGGRLAALFVLVAVAATLTVSSAFSAGASRRAQAGPAPSVDSQSAALPGGPALKSSSLGATAQDDVSGPSLTTDKSSYAPGDTITFRGANWTPGENVTIVLRGGGEGPAVEIQATADESGSFTVTGTMPEGEEQAAAKSRSSNAARAQAQGAASATASAGESYTATATGDASGASTQVQIGKGTPGEPDGDESDPDLPAFMAKKTNKADYLRRRSEHVNKLRHPPRQAGGPRRTRPCNPRYEPAGRKARQRDEYD
jgi:hypothetical protein